jgi:hypothetical protein
VRPGVWRVVAVTHCGPDGKKRYTTQTVKGTEKDAQAALKQLQGRYTLATHDIEGSRTTVAAVLARWIVVGRGDWSPGTVRDRTGLVEQTIVPAWPPADRHADRARGG